MDGEIERRLPLQREGRMGMLDWMHWFNEHRLPSSIGHITPVEIEQQYREMNPQQQPLLGELALH